VRLSIVAFLLAMSLPVLAFGLEPSAFSLVDSPQANWLNPEFSSSVGFSFVTSGGRSWGTGTYIGSLLFDLHPNLTATLDLGYSRLFNFGGDDANRFLGGLDLDWTPTDALKLQFHYSGSIPTEALGSF